MDNPFFIGTSHGHRFYDITADDRIMRVRSFDKAQCDAALRLDGLQRTVIKAIERRLRQLAKMEAQR